MTSLNTNKSPLENPIPVHHVTRQIDRNDSGSDSDKENNLKALGLKIRTQIRELDIDFKTQIANSSSPLVQKVELLRPQVFSQEAVAILEEKFGAEEATKITDFVSEHLPEWQSQARLIGETIHLKPDSMPRSLQVNPDGKAYILFNRVGQGDELLGEGKVKKAKTALSITGEIVARKSATLKATEAEKFRAEFEISSEFDHEGIAKTHKMSYIESPKGESVKLGYLENHYNGGDLYEAVNYIEPNEEELQLVMEKLLSGLTYIHDEKKAIHRDIKSLNVFTSRNPSDKRITDAVIGDLGEVCRQDDQDAKEQPTGTFQYYSPEYAKAVAEGDPDALREASTPMQDTWALGLTLLEFIKYNEDLLPSEWDLERPIWYEFESSEEILNYLSQLPNKNNIEWLQWLPEPIGNERAHLIWRMLRPNIQDRISSREAYEIIQQLKP